MAAQRRRLGALTQLPNPVHAVFALVFYAGLLAGSAWIAADLWYGHEESELLRIPYRPLRIAVVLVLITLLLDAMRRLLHKVRA